MSSSNAFQGSDIASLLSMIQGGGPQNSRNQQQAQQQNGGNLLQNVVNQGQNSNDPSMLSSLVHSLAGALQQQQQQQHHQQQQQQRNGASDMLSLLAAQQLGVQGVDFSRLTGSALLGNLQGSGQNNQFSQSQQKNLANIMGASQGSQQLANQEQALALARLAGARLLSANGTRDDGRKVRELTQDNLKNQAKRMEADSSSPFLVHRKSAQTSSASSEEDSTHGKNLEPGAIAVPCRARGMPMDHNPLTAYFVINNGISHGEDVVCSHPACRNAGIKFRHCSFCKAPVAKRNFRRRHNHGCATSTTGSDDESNKLSPMLSSASAPSSRKIISASEDEPEAKRAKILGSEDDDADTNEESSKSSSECVRKGTIRKEPIHAVKSSNSEKLCALEPTTKSDAPTITGEGDSTTTIKASRKTISLDRRENWSKLLEERPITNDADQMSAWIDKILKVSDIAHQVKVDK